MKSDIEMLKQERDEWKTRTEILRQAIEKHFQSSRSCAYCKHGRERVNCPRMAGAVDKFNNPVGMCRDNSEWEFDINRLLLGEAMINE